jgi:hypothetical protein
VADSVLLRNPDTGEELTRPKAAAPFFINQGYVVIDAAGRENPKATAAAATVKKEN